MVREPLDGADTLRERVEQGSSPSARGVWHDLLVCLLVRLGEKLHRRLTRGQVFLDPDHEFHLAPILFLEDREVMELRQLLIRTGLRESPLGNGHAVEYTVSEHRQAMDDA